LCLDTIAYCNFNKSLLFRDTLFGTKCCQIEATTMLYHCSVVKFEHTTIFHDPRWITLNMKESLHPTFSYKIKIMFLSIIQI
jgi:hypothetical protein